MNLPGVKPLQLLALFVGIIAATNYKKSVKMPDYVRFFSLAMIAIFTISLIRSLSYLDLFNFYLDNKLSTQRYLLSHFVKPLIFFMPLIIVVKFVYRKTDIEYLVNTLTLSILILSVVITYLYFFKGLGKGDIETFREYFQSIFSLHTNSIANFYIMAFPFVIAKFFVKKNILTISNIILSAMAIGMLYSRAAYLTCLLSFISYFFLSRRTKFLPFLIAVAFGLFFIISSSVIERASKGIESRDRNALFAGRIEKLWVPLIYEYTHDYKKLILGNGRYAIRSSDVNKQGIIREATHPHNMYLEQIIDAGLIGVVTFIAFYIILLRKACKSLGNINDYKIKEHHYAVIVSLSCYLISGITDRSFFPDPANGFLWVVVGIAIVIIRMSQETATSEGVNIN
ncbi:MAG: O-antigen ligase family protein [Deltaproteobacteria bacterium]|jgi:hypothetical protein|nr:O-antigen ligase family protein [Deltaproteobacteria bacterium]